MRTDAVSDRRERRPAPVPRPCAAEGCANLVVDPWEETGRLCPRCAVDNELFDRDARRDRVFAA